MKGARPALGTPTLGAMQAELLVSLATDGDRALLRRVVEALALARDQGHVCLDLRDLRGVGVHDDGSPPWPDLGTLRRELLATGIVEAVDEASGREPVAAPLPLVLDASDRLYTLRHHRAERTIAAFVQERLQRAPSLDAADLHRALDRVGLRPSAADGKPDWQLAAVVAGASRSLTVLCGGPGTGKTTTVARLLAVLLQLEPDLRIAVTAPTGKAAARLAEALAERVAAGTDGRAAPPTALLRLEPRTLHRLLGYLPLDDAFRYGKGRPLPFDLVVVDEVSMVDPAIFAALCEALSPATRLVLVGDKDQLAAVAAGQVLGDLTAAARPERGVGPQLAAYVADVTGMQLPSQPDAAPMADATVALWTNHRFRQSPGIGGFAHELLQRRADAAMAVFEAGHDDLERTADLDAALAVFLPRLVHQLDSAYAAASRHDAETALAAIAHARILTAQRRGPTGAADWNRRVEARLMALGRLRPGEPFYLGRPVLVTQNDSQTRVWNGDLGVVGRDRDGQPVVWLRDQRGEVRALHPRRLPAHETAWAMTVHKAQGSEFDHVLLLLPDRDGPLLHAPLIYTGVTRARRRALVGGTDELLRLGLSRWPERRSGLADALRARRFE